MLVEENKTKNMFCPFKSNSLPSSNFCLASYCMAWIKETDTRGECALCQKRGGC